MEGWEAGRGGLSVSSGPFDSSLWADGGASAAAPAAGAASVVVVEHHGRRAHRDRCEESGTAPGSSRAAALVSSLKCLEVV